MSTKKEMSSASKTSTGRLVSDLTNYKRARRRSGDVSSGLSEGLKINESKSPFNGKNSVLVKQAAHH